VITHNHDDHAGGLLTLRQELRKKSKDALSRAHVGEGILLSRPGPDGKESNPFLAIAAAYKLLGGSIVEHPAPTQLLPNVWMTGPVPRVHPERNWSGTGRLMGANGLVEDTIPEDASVVVDTPEGLILVSGCGHAGFINTVEYARRVVRPAPLAAAIGGFHLFAADDAHLEWTGRRLKEFGLQHLIGAHCTGLEATFRLRTLTGLTRKTAVIGAVGARFIRGRGIEPGWLAQ
jgi:7,8-dihydropterin-6-yl-methyl-4-(beta-D-ribofuranosyl)aminobenzene 5'-phosphate synthase